MSKAVTGVGYILLILGIIITVAGMLAQSGFTILGGALLSIIAFLLINIGFITMGRKYHKGAWTATGVIGLIVFILYSVGIALMAHALLTALGEAYMGEGMEGLSGVVAGAAGVMGIAGILAFVWVIMEIVVLWSAANFFGSGTLKAAAILKIIAIVLSLVAIPAIAIGVGMGAMGEGLAALFALGITFLVILGVVILLLIVSLILAGIGFLTAKEPTAYRPQTYGGQVAPPPPPV